jgi:hypothetical protein
VRWHGRIRNPGRSLRLVLHASSSLFVSFFAMGRRPVIGVRAIDGDSVVGCRQQASESLGRSSEAATQNSEGQ